MNYQPFLLGITFSIPPIVVVRSGQLKTEKLKKRPDLIKKNCLFGSNINLVCVLRYKKISVRNLCPDSKSQTNLKSIDVIIEYYI